MTTLSEAVGGPKRVIGGPFGSKLTTRDYSDTGVPVIRGGNMEFDGRWIGGPYACVTEEKVAKDLKTNLANPGDIIVTQRGTLGQVSIVPDASPHPRFVISQSQMAISVDRTRIDRDYLYYFLRSPIFTDYSHSQTIQTGVPHINLGILRDAPLQVPPLSAQRHVARILGALDDKIELNRRMSATLEEMARVLYRSWFVNFDPVHARALGQPPAHMPPTTAALFPDSFGPDGLPKGWKETSLDEIATFLNGAALQKFPAAEDENWLPVIKIAELRGGLTAKSNKAGLQVPEKYKIYDGDVLFSWSGSLLQKVWTDGPGALNQHLFKVWSEVVPKWFHFFAVDQHMDEFRQIAASKATTMGHIQRHHLKEAQVAIPTDKSVIRAADKLIAPIFARATTADLECHKLAGLRDTLLPRLMSGDVRIREAENQVEEVV